MNKKTQNWGRQLTHEEKDEYYIITSTPDSLKRLAEEGMMREGIPIVFDELDADDKKQHRGKLTANFMKQLTGVKDGGVLGARYQDFALHKNQPRMINSNAESMDKWLDGITSKPEDRLALRKRIAFFHVPQSVIPVSANETYDQELEAYANAGSMRLARKLKRPL